MRRQALLVIVLDICHFLYLVPTITLGLRPSQPCSIRPPTTRNKNRQRLLAAGNKDSTKGVYSRPSSAIERGSGFFVPGLEGAKVRLAVGILLLGVTAVNHYGDPLVSITTMGNTFAEALAAVFAILVLLQAAIEFRKERSSDNGFGFVRTGTSSQIADAAKTPTTLVQVWSVPPLDDGWKNRVEWAAGSYLALTPATEVMLLGPGKVVYSLGSIGLGVADMDTASRAALETLSRSKSGRVSLPMNHPSCQALQDTNREDDDTGAPTTIRCALLQRVSEKSQLCWMIISDQLLASFTRQDLQWLGRLAVYIDPDRAENEHF
jgi:hypothetical protein